MGPSLQGVEARGRERSGQQALQLQFFWNGQQGDERAMVGKMRTGQLDGATITGDGLGEIYASARAAAPRPVSRLEQARRRAKRHACGLRRVVRATRIQGARLGRRRPRALDEQGFSSARARGLKHRRTYYLPAIRSRPWSSRSSATSRRGKSPCPRFYRTSPRGRSTCSPRPPLVAEQLQWASRLDNLGDDVAGIGIGALVFSSARYRAIPADAQTILADTGRVAGEALTRRIRAEDDAALARLEARMTHYALTASERAEWEKLFVETARRLRGAVFDAAIFDDAVRYAQ